MKNDLLMTETEIFYEMGIKNPNKPRLMVKSDSGWQSVTWGKILDCATKISLYFSNMDVGLNTKVAIFAKNQVEYAYFDVAIHAVRSVFVPIYISNTPEQVKYIINHSDTEVIVTELERLPVLFRIWKELPFVRKVIIVDFENEDNLLKTLEKFVIDTGIALTLTDIKDKVVSLKDIYQQSTALEKENSQGLKPFMDEIQSKDVSAILYTSGTTGNPKGVVLTRYNLHANSEDWINVLGNLIPETRIDLLWLPMSHIFGWGELGLGNTLDFTTYMTTPTEVLNDMPLVKPTIFMSVPAYWEKLYLGAKAFSDQKAQQISQLHELTGGRLKFCLSGGAGLKREIKRFFYEAGLLIIEGYGLTECSPTLTMNRRNSFDFNSVGKPFPKVQLKLMGDGEILVKGQNVFKEYYQDPQATTAAFDNEGWFKTGDLGELIHKGFLKIKGRKKEIIVTSGGKNISPQLIEPQFNDDPHIEHIVLYGNERKYLTALVTLNKESVINYATEMQIPYKDYSALVHNPQIRAHIQKSIDRVNENLASFETIKKFLIHDGHLTVETGFLTHSLKLKRNRVYEEFKNQLDTLYEKEKLS
jgi:long-chain acyl-CoA synthetase